VKDPAIIAFTTTSSDAALPLAMERMIEFGVPRRIVAFVMPTGYSFNLDGSTLYLGVASIFVAQAAGIHMTLGQQLAMMLTLLITSKGIAAVPRASLVVLSGVLTTYGLPLEGVAVILGVDELMDMARTMINLIGNCLATAVMGRWEGELKFGPEAAPAHATAAAPARASERAGPTPA
jgi:proton glutamate symport protein